MGTRTQFQKFWLKYAFKVVRTSCGKNFIWTCV